MSKILARELPPEAVDFGFYFDNDGFTSAGGENCAIYIPAIDRRHIGFNQEEYNDIVSKAEHIIEEFYDIERLNSGYDSYKEVMEDYGIEYSPKRCHDLKEWAKNEETTPHAIAEFLTLTTGKEYGVNSFTGYSQGDYCEVVYCKDTYSYEDVKEIGKMWFGCGTEFCISEPDGDKTYGYYITDDVRWTEDNRLVNKLAEIYGCKPEELRVEIWDGGGYKCITEELGIDFDTPENISEKLDTVLENIENVKTVFSEDISDIRDTADEITRKLEKAINDLTVLKDLVENDKIVEQETPKKSKANIELD